MKKILLVSLFAFLAFSRLWRLGEPSSYYFDEVYHAFTAQAYAQNDARAYEWWHEAPEGFAYEWLHPPLGKLFQAGSIKLLGDTPFSWRLPGAIFGFLTGVLLYLIGKDIFKSAKIGILALMFWTFDGLSLTMSRITMNDVFLTFWVLLAFYLFLAKRPLWQIGAALGLAVATKWSGAFAITLITGLWFWQNRKISFKQAAPVFSFLIITAAIYLLSYTQFFLQGHSLEQFFGLHSQTWWYQTNLEATHPYSSAPYQWPFGTKALFAYTDGEGKNIYLAGNPVLWWGGLVALIILFVKRKGADFRLMALTLGYFSMFLPWMLSPRILFIYHYLPALPFLFLILAWWTNKLYRENKGWIVVSFLTLTFAFFILYYPLWTAFPTPTWWSNLLIP